MPYSVPQLTDFSEEALKQVDNQLLTALGQEAQAVSSAQEWDVFRNRWLARKNGILTQVNELWLKAVPAEVRPQTGQLVNQVRKQIENFVESAKAWSVLNGRVDLPPGLAFKSFEEQIRVAEDLVAKNRLAAERLDITLPGTRRPLGAEHPVMRTMHEIIYVFRNLGYSVEEGPEIETDYYNFEALNFPPNHPARDTQDTLFIAGQDSKPQRDRLLLRTHTSPVQIRSMEKMKPPVRVVCPGKVHRNDAPDATHSPIFHQVEGLAVDTNITFCDLKGTLDHAMKALFGSSVKTRFYPSFFPFTEPSADVQISCIFCDGKGVRDGGPCRNCKASGWIELLGCGMVDPNVYGFVDYDPGKVSGFAFGMGVERIAILKYGVDDIQLFFNGDVRFLEQFG